MVKAAAMLFIALGFSLFGFYAASVYEKKVEILDSVVMMLSVMQTQLSYSRIPLASLLGRLEENRKINGLGFISACKKETENGEPFPESWRICIENEKELCRLIPEVLPYLFQIGEDLGSTDLEGQLSCCKYYEGIFRRELAEKEAQSGKYSKLFPTLGVTLGITAVILII